MAIDQVQPRCAWLSQAEIDDMCEPLTQSAAQIRYLRDTLKLTVRAKPNGRPFVLRSNVEEVLGGLPDKHKRSKATNTRTPVQPDAAGLVLAFTRGSVR